MENNPSLAVKRLLHESWEFKPDSVSNNLINVSAYVWISRNALKAFLLNSLIYSNLNVTEPISLDGESYTLTYSTERDCTLYRPKSTSAQLSCDLWQSNKSDADLSVYSVHSRQEGDTLSFIHFLSSIGVIVDTMVPSIFSWGRALFLRLEELSVLSGESIIFPAQADKPNTLKSSNVAFVLSSSATANKLDVSVIKKRDSEFLTK